MPTYNLSIPPTHFGSAFMAQAAAKPTPPVTLTNFERVEIDLYLQEWADDVCDSEKLTGDEKKVRKQALVDKVEAALHEVMEPGDDGPRVASVNIDVPLPDLSRWLIDVQRSGPDAQELPPRMSLLLTHWRAGGDGRDQTYQAIVRKIASGSQVFTLQYAGDLPNLNEWGITIRGHQAAAGAGARTLNSRSVESVAALAPRTISSIQNLIRDIPQASLWTGTRREWSDRCMQVFHQATDAIDKLNATTDAKLDLLTTLFNTFNDRISKYAEQDKGVFRDSLTLADEIAPAFHRCRARLQKFQRLTDWRAAVPDREMAYQKILAAVERGAKLVTVQHEGNPPNLSRTWG